MRLAEFILTRTGTILTEWDTFARSIWPEGAVADPAEIRDHAEDILRATARDMESEQSTAEQSKKSHGKQVQSASSLRIDNASVEHAGARVTSGFKLNEVMAEYRALRACVLRLWRESHPPPSFEDLEDVTRFNESIDQSLTKAVAGFTQHIEHSRQMFLSIIGHDLRNPLSAITLWAHLSGRRAALHDDPTLSDGLTNIAESASAMSEMITALNDFASSAAGGTIKIQPRAIDLKPLCEAVIRETCAAFSQCTVCFDHRGDLAATWDLGRVRQVLSNLLSNAIQHGGPGCDINLVVNGKAADTVVITVQNVGPTIPAESLETIFEPLVQVGANAAVRHHRPGSIGLGLYIVREIAQAHGGTIDVTSTATAGTTFTVKLPRHAK